MFYEGDLQSGIGLAIDGGKTVVCFVTDSGEESRTWEQEWLSDPHVSDVLAAQAVVLRIAAASQEAGFLSAFCPVDKTPSLVLIRDGQLKENLKAGLEREEFVRRLRGAFGLPAQTDEGVGEGSAPPAQTDEERTQVQQPATEAQQPATPAQQPTTQVQQPTTQVQQPTTQVQQPAAAGAAAYTSRQEQRGRPVPPGNPAPPPAPSSSGSGVGAARVDYAAQQRQRLAVAKKERERVMAQIEADKAARKAREKARKEAEVATISRLADEEPLPTSTLSAAGASKGTAVGLGATANIQVRLFSGRTLRTTFPATATLGSDVRAWVDEAAAEDAGQSRPPPYIFKHMLNPLPSRSLEVGEETHSLAELNMLPSATLVLVPVQGAVVDAFGALGVGGPSGAVGYVYGAASGAVGMVGSTLGWGASSLGSLVGWGGGTGSSGEEAAASSARSTAAAEGSDERDAGKGKARMRTLADQRADDAKDKPETWYNGNQLSFQPKDNPDEDKG